MNSSKKAVFILIFMSAFGWSWATTLGVVPWTEQTLINTLSINYQDLTTTLKTEKINYSPAAWQALDSFLGDKISNIQNNKLSLHPKALDKGAIINSGTILNIDYWAIRQTYLIPELNLTLDCSVVVIRIPDGYLIHSINIQRQSTNLML